jgi:hypothetical protein
MLIVAFEEAAEFYSLATHLHANIQNASKHGNSISLSFPQENLNFTQSL